MGICWVRNILGNLLIGLHEWFLSSIKPFTDIKYKNSYTNISKITFLTKKVKSLTKKNVKINKRTNESSDSNKELHDNCFIEASHGNLLCICYRNKGQWYLDQNLVNLYKEDPFTIRLSFELEKALSIGGVGEYYRISKENRCVACGLYEEGFIRKNVPKEYRKHFAGIIIQ